MSNYFEGWYFKHQKNNQTVAIIPGRTNEEAFIQVITENGSYYVKYPLCEYKKKNKSDIVAVEKNRFTASGIGLDIHSADLDLTGEIRYKSLTPLKSDIMGCFRFLPMQCRHGVISMRHQLTGKIVLNGAEIDFTGGVGYIESDSGRSFPKSYTWVQCNDFNIDCSIMASIAHIPFAGLWFWGCIGVVRLGSAEYRLATYNGVKIIECTENRIEIQQKELRLAIEIPGHSGHSLFAPDNGVMNRSIRESAATPARFEFNAGDGVSFDLESKNASFEYVSTCV